MKPLWDRHRRVGQLRDGLATRDKASVHEAAWALYHGRAARFFASQGVPEDHVDDCVARVVMHVSQKATATGVTFADFESFLLHGARYELMTWLKSCKRTQTNRQHLAAGIASTLPAPRSTSLALIAREEVEGVVTRLAPPQRTLLRGMLLGTADEDLIEQIRERHGSSLTLNALRLRKTRIRRMLPTDWGDL